MSVRNDGTVRCDRCNGEVGGGGVGDSAVISVLHEDATVRLFHLCIVSDATHERCATRVGLGGAATAAFPEPFVVWTPPPPASPPAV